MSDGPKMRRPNVDYRQGGRAYRKTSEDSRRARRKAEAELELRISRGHVTCADQSRGVQRFHYHMSKRHLVCRQSVRDALRDAESFSQMELCDSAKKALQKARDLAKRDCGPGPTADEAIERKMKAQGLFGLKKARRSHRRRK